MFLRSLFFEKQGHVLRSGFLCSMLYALCSVGAQLCAPTVAHAAAQPPIVQQNMMQSGGSANLTAFQGNVGALNNNQWNALMNVGKGTGAGAGAPADFGNCNAVIIRCAQPKCGSTGCTDSNVAIAIANGCVMADNNCKQYGTDLTNAIAAQLVAQSTANANAQKAQAAAAAAASQNTAATQQMAAMADQMTQMQQQMQKAQADSDAKIQAALAAAQQQQTAAAAAAAAQPAAAATDTNVTGTTPMTDVAQAVAAKSGISVDVLLREQASGQILSKLDDVKASLANTKAAMLDAFTYAGCDANGSGCMGPRRVMAFKSKANKFFDPYIETLAAVQDAVIQAQALGVDLTDIYMMLNNSCNSWGKFMCPQNVDSVWQYVDENNNKCDTNNYNQKCTQKMNPNCQLIQILNSTQEVQQDMLYPDQGLQTGGAVKVLVGCASDAVSNSKLFKVLNRQTVIGVDELQMVLGTDYTPNATTGPNDKEMICNMYNVSGDPVTTLQTLVNSRNPNLAAATASGGTPPGGKNPGTGTGTGTDDEYAFCNLPNSGNPALKNWAALGFVSAQDCLNRENQINTDRQEQLNQFGVKIQQQAQATAADQENQYYKNQADARWNDMIAGCKSRCEGDAGCIKDCQNGWDRSGSKDNHFAIIMADPHSMEVQISNPNATPLKINMPVKTPDNNATDGQTGSDAKCQYCKDRFMEGSAVLESCLRLNCK
ncbi:MAG: hypothetical protein FWC51_02145 [Proteobacteria bacterium]|nr:hypothetical protein [Pseudomonadota bacterium]